MSKRGPKKGGQRGKMAKHLRAGTQKKFRNDNEEARTKYKQKIVARQMRKTKKRK
jgi:hypothetical protein